MIDMMDHLKPKTRRRKRETPCRDCGTGLPYLIKMKTYLAIMNFSITTSEPEVSR